MSTQESLSGQGRLLTTLQVSGRNPISGQSGKSATGWELWVGDLKEGANRAHQEMDGESSGPYRLRIEVRLCPKKGTTGSDLDNYVGPIQNALADAHVFGWTTQQPGVMRGDERIDRLDISRKLVSNIDDAGVVAEVWSLPDDHPISTT